MGETTEQRIRKRKSYSMWADIEQELMNQKIGRQDRIRILLRMYRRMEEAAIFGSRQRSDWVFESMVLVISDKTDLSVDEVEAIAKKEIHGKT